MKKLLTISLAALALGIAALVGWVYWTTQSQINEAVRSLKRAVAKDFNDPESARFRSLRLQTDEGTIKARMKLVDLKFLWRSTPEEVFSVFRYDPEAFHLCGEVNAKNAFSAYVGYKYFWISARKEPVPFIATREGDKFPQEMCDISKDQVVYTEPDAI